jgi:hypothetical protein
MVKSKQVSSKTIGANASNIKSNLGARPVLRPSTHSKSKWIFLIGTTIVFLALILLFLMSGTEQATKTTSLTESQSQATGAQPSTPAEAAAQFITDNEENDEDTGGLIGMAITGFKELNPALNTLTLPVDNGKAMINPKTGTVYTDTKTSPYTPAPFVIQVEAIPHYAGSTDPNILRANNFEITLKYFAADFDFVSANVYSDTQGIPTKINNPASWKPTPPVVTPDGAYNRVTFYAEGGSEASNYFPLNQDVILAELIFKPKKTTGIGQIILESVKVVKGSWVISTNVDPNKNTASLSFNLKVYEDLDGDTYGNLNKPAYQDSANILPSYVKNAADCNDDKNPTPVIMKDNNVWTCDKVTSCTNIPPDNIVLNTITDYNDYYGPECAKCQKPGISEICDGIDNNCNGQKDEGVAPTCGTKNCGFFYMCKGSTLLDCNKNPDNPALILNFDGHEACQKFSPATPFCDVATGNCIASLGQDCTSCQNDLTACQTKLNTCIGNLPTCNIAECTTLGGTCNEKGQCIVPGSSCTSVGSTVTFIKAGGISINYVSGCKSGADGKQYSEQYSCNGANLVFTKSSCPAGCDAATGLCKASCPQVMCPSCPTITIIKELTPACEDGIIHPPATTKCDAFENCKTCSADCGACPSTADSELVDPVTGNGPDGVPDSEELTNAEIEALKYTALKARLLALGKTCAQLKDCDGDGITDDKDYCPNTDSSDGQITAKTGFVNAYGCYATDTGTGLASPLVRPDGCFSSYDTTFYISYYTNLIGGGACNNVFGNPVAK